MNFGKISFWIFLIVLVSGTQLISAYETGDTKITGPDSGPIKDITVDEGEPIALHTKLHSFSEFSESWFTEKLRYLDFYVFKTDDIVLNGECVFHDKASTNLFTNNANPHTFTLPSGDYNLIISYYGNFSGTYLLKSCFTTAKIHVI